MVDINLNQEDSYKEQNFKEDDSFQQTLNIESHDFADDRGKYQSDIPEFPKSSSNSRIYILAFIGLIIVVALVVYFMSGSNSTAPDEFAALDDPDLLESPLEENPIEESQGEISSETATPTPQMTEEVGLSDFSNTQPTADLSSMSPIERETRISSYLGKLTIDGVTNALGGNGVVTLVRFSNNSFLVELVAGSTAAMNQIVSDIRANTGTPDIRVISQESTAIQGRSVVKALLSGSVDVNSAPAMMKAYVGATTDFSSWVRSAARSNQLSVKNLAESAGSEANSFQINLQGSLSSALEFLNAFEDVSSGILVEKISLINNDLFARSANSVSLVMVVKKYRM
jgi:hypothetical protein